LFISLLLRARLGSLSEDGKNLPYLVRLSHSIGVLQGQWPPSRRFEDTVTSSLAVKHEAATLSQLLNFREPEVAG
jgi:hypothetical protein